MNCRSHAKEEIIEAQKNNQTIWYLDSGESGSDDMLIGEDKKQVLADIMAYHGKLPKKWTLDKVDWIIE